ncbi:SMI1/KNR4 family protein [Rhodococcus sp. G-MC3]|uniref:SMI1/KNR4 family protein n=1 Tax=Rhodococcus sp. G-MC3 TaxID=3046209 RepID=UPI0024BA1D33|nr:SMI1/KNR4 family protein [Rhodococcus sp. G-MC3]MDJ0396114.1 SMI1/KNR4 family protein [Rhodococcus sp. G-MC3]
MTLTEVWSAYLAALRVKAPITVESLRPPRELADLQDIERATTPWPDDLREFFLLHDGQHLWVGDRLAGTLLLDSELLSLEDMQFERSSWLESPHAIDDLGDEWPAQIAAQQAGETAHLFLPEYVPIAKDGAGGLCYIDTRPGPKQSCVRFFSADAADEGGPAYGGLADYLDALRTSVESETEFDGVVPTFDDGALVWELDRSDWPPALQLPDPVVLRLPFEPVEFRPSQWTADDDVIDLDVVRRTVVDTARALYPGSAVDDDARLYTGTFRDCAGRT